MFPSPSPSPSKSKQPQSQSQSQSNHPPNDYGSNLWIRNPQRRHATAGRGLFAGLQDAKNYNVDDGWAKRTSQTQDGFGAKLWGYLGTWVWGRYTPPRD